MAKYNCPKVSIIIPIYNTEEYLSQCLESVLNQTLYDIEIICIDDASSDHSFEIICDYAQKDGRIIVLQNNVNRGLSATRNVGIKAASGEYIQFLDSDDCIKENAVELLYELAYRNNLDVVFFGAEVIGSKTTDHFKKYGYKKSQIFSSGVSFFMTVNEENEYQSASCFQFWRKQFLLEHSLYFYEGIVYEDTLFTLRTSLKARRLMTIPEMLYMYREHENSISHSLGIEQLQSCVIVYEQIVKIWMESAYSDQIENGIRKRLDLFERRIRYLLGSVAEKPKIEFDSVFQTYMYEMFCKMPTLKSLYIDNLDADRLARLQKAERVYIYGAGEIASDVVRILEESNVEIAGILVTKNQENVNEFHAYPVIEVDELQGKQDKSIVVLALARRWHPDVISKLERLQIEYMDVLL